MSFNRQHTTETSNIHLGADLTASGIDPALLEFEVSGDFWGVLEELNGSLVVSREYEHFVVALDASANLPWQSVMPIPHPSGLFYDQDRKELLLSSTRTPNIIQWYRSPGDHFVSLVTPEGMDLPAGSLYLPTKAAYMPGTLYIHDVAMIAGRYFATVTGHNFLAEFDDEGRWWVAWHPAVLDSIPQSQRFRTNFFQLNSIALAGDGPEDCYYTAFSDLTTGAKPWKEGYGPREKGVVFSGRSREPIVRDLTCPHSAKVDLGGGLILCNSGYGEVGVVELGSSRSEGCRPFEVVSRLPGFTRGLAITEEYVFVGLSRVIDKYEPYAPGLEPEVSKCGIWILDKNTGETVASLDWVNGYQIYDLQIVPSPLVQFPVHENEDDGINHFLRYMSHSFS